MSVGLKKGTVVLEPHQEIWDIEGMKICARIRDLLGNDIVDVQHVGSTSIRWISAKPVIDAVAGVRSFQDITKHNDQLFEQGIICRGQDVPGQYLYRCTDPENDLVTHFIHVVIHDSDAWENYINFRDYLNARPEKAKEYESVKLELCRMYPEDRALYTEGKKEIISRILSEARAWRRTQTE